MKIYSTPLQIPFDPVNPEIIYSLPRIRHQRFDISLINSSLIGYLNNLNLEICHAEVFYAKPFLNSAIHIDYPGGDITKINWIYNGEECYMNWYSINSGDSTQLFSDTTIGTKYKQFNKGETTLEYSEILQSPSIVDVGTPHNIVNGKNDRWCLSIVHRHKITKRRLSMFQSLKTFKSSHY